MKKLYSALLSLALVAPMAVNAQQLPNNDFEGSWPATTPWESTGGAPTVGTSPENWTIAHVAGYKVVILGWTGKTQVGSQIAGYNSDKAVHVVNSANSVVSSQTVPGYVTLGTPWNTANTSGNNKDGGTFGGISFSYRPDALSFMYKRERTNSSSTEQATILCYSWKGSYTQANVPGNINSTPTKVTMTDRERNILGVETTYGDTPVASNDFEKVMAVIHPITTVTSTWTNLEIPLEYFSNSTPSKINVIFGSGNYFSTSPEQGNSLDIDDVKLLYYSRLASLSVNGGAVADFDSKTYEYTIDSEMPAADAFSFTTLSNSGSSNATIALDTNNAVATITVTNSNNGGTDYDGKTNHVYTIQFNKPQGGGEEPEDEPSGIKYDGQLVVSMLGSDIVDQPDRVYIDPKGDGTCTFLLKNFAIDLGDGPVVLGDIVVENVTMTTAGGTITYNGTANDFTLLDGALETDITLSGTETNGKLKMDINVLWKNTGDEPIEIGVTFNGQRDLASIGGIEVDGNEGAAQYFNLQGIRVNGENLTPGFYIVRQGDKVSKIYVK